MRRRGFPVLRLLRALLVLVIGIGLYLVIPIPGENGLSAVVVLLLALAAVLAVTGWAVQRAWVMDKVGDRVRLLALVLYVAVIVFALAYTWVGAVDPGAFTERMDRMDALYFTVTVLATVGFGDITAVTTEARLLVTFQMAFNIMVVSTAIGLIVNTPRSSQPRD
jgi:voltage-gated potassium channel